MVLSWLLLMHLLHFPGLPCLMLHPLERFMAADCLPSVRWC